MASYQMPQFLDSGDKILGPLNLRQFGYALGGFMLGLAVFSVVSSLFPRLGILAWGPSIPIILLAAYLALGKYNGRDTDIYAYKYFLYLLKPKYMTYQRHPYIDDLNEKMGDWTLEKINKRWTDQVVSKTNVARNEYLEFTSGDSEDKAERIRRIGGSLDQNYINSMTDAQRLELIIKQKEEMLNSIRHPQGANNIVSARGLRVPLPTAIPSSNSEPKSDLNEHNFFEV